MEHQTGGDFLQSSDFFSFFFLLAEVTPNLNPSLLHPILLYQSAYIPTITIKQRRESRHTYNNFKTGIYNLTLPILTDTKYIA